MQSLFSSLGHRGEGDGDKAARASSPAELLPAQRGAGGHALIPALQLAQPSEMMVALQALPGTPTPNLLAWERFRVLRTHLATLTRERNLRTLLVTSAVAGEGKTLMAANLALSFSQLENKRVLLVDGDLRRPSLAEFFAVPAEIGLADCLQNGKGIKDVRQRLHPTLDLVPTLPAFEDSVELLNRHRMRDLLADTEEYDLVIIDSPPMSPIADTQVLARLVDGALLVVRSGVAHYELVRQAAELLQPKLLGAVLNCMAGGERNDYFYRYYQRNEGGRR